MKGIILSTHPTIGTWKTLQSKLDFFNRIYKSGKNSEWENWTLEQVTFTPKVNAEGKIDHDWLTEFQMPYFNAGYDFVKLHGSIAQKKAWGIKTSLNGANPKENYEHEAMYFFADENTKRKGLNQFEQSGAHEGSHGYFQETKFVDMTHAWHNANADISGLFKTFDWSLYQPKRMNLKKQVSLLTRIVDLMKQLATLNRNKSDLQPLVKRKADLVIAEMKRKGHPVRIVEGFRSFERQDSLYAQGRTKPGAIVTNAKGGQSFHNYGVAVDFIFVKEGYNASSTLWSLLGSVGKAQGFEWGGDWTGFVDRPHFQLTLGYTISDFQKNNKVDYTKYK